MFNNSNKAQMSFIFGIMMLVVVILMFTALYPVLTSAFQGMRGSDGANCPGNPTYNATAITGTDTLSCTISGFAPGMILLVVVFGLVAAMVSGKVMTAGDVSPTPYG